MQPVLMISSPVNGLVYINGRLAGELMPDEPISMPVSPRGALYLEHRALADGYLPLARRVTMSNGAILPASVADGEGLGLVLWPEGVCEIELTPEPISGRADDAQAYPSLLPGAQVMEDGSVRTFELLDDVAGHARLSVWQQNQTEWTRAHSELMWAQGAPNWPDTPEKTAIAAVEAAILGLSDEAAGYLTQAGLLNALLSAVEAAKGCVPMRYGAHGKTAVGLVDMVSPRAARVRPMYYRAVATGGPQGTWRLSDISVESSDVY